MSERQANINREALAAATRVVEPKIWGRICMVGRSIGNKSVGPIFGYNLFRRELSNDETAIKIEAELEARLERRANPDRLITFIRQVASGFSDEVHILQVVASPNYPMMRVLRDDPAFGISPRIPASIGFKLYYDRGPFTIPA